MLTGPEEVKTGSLAFMTGQRSIADYGTNQEYSE
jgi:hypothetical protein